MHTIEQIIEIASRNLKLMSRTANGNVDVSASAAKYKIMEIQDGAEAADFASSNFENALKFCYDNRNRKFNSERDLQEFIENTARKINHGIVKEGNLIRGGSDSEKYKYTRIKDLDEELKWFYKELLARFNSDKYNAEETAAFIEFYINLRIHIFADGCNKTSMALATYAMMRGEKLPVQYRDRSEYYSHGIRSIDKCGSPNDIKAYQEFLEYYRTLSK